VHYDALFALIIARYSDYLLQKLLKDLKKMSGKFIAQMIIQLTAVGSRVFVSAYQQALNNAKKGGGTAQQQMARVAVRGKMAKEEALQILNMEHLNLGDVSKLSNNKKEVAEKFKKMYDANDPSKGGSFYLQSKIYRAHEAIIREIDPESLAKEKEKMEAETAGTANDGNDDGVHKASDSKEEDSSSSNPPPNTENTASGAAANARAARAKRRAAREAKGGK
jgi:mitochondrial import inner membrane translocase subunit TIM16